MYCVMDTTLILAARIMPRMFDTKELTSKTHAMGRRAGSMAARLAFDADRPGGHAVPLGIVPIFWTQVHLERRRPHNRLEGAGATAP